MTKDNLISTERLATELRKSPETVRRWARAGTIPHIKGTGGKGTDYKFDRIAVFEHFVKQDIIQSLENVLQDPALPGLIRKNITMMIDGVRNGWLSVDQVGEVWHEMFAG
jgi:hypothetical protein